MGVSRKLKVILIGLLLNISTASYSQAYYMHEAAEDAGYRPHDSPLLGIIAIIFLGLMLLVAVMVFFASDKDDKKNMLGGCLSYILLNPITLVTSSPLFINTKQGIDNILNLSDKPGLSSTSIDMNLISVVDLIWIQLV